MPKAAQVRAEPTFKSSLIQCQKPGSFHLAVVLFTEVRACIHVELRRVASEHTPIEDGDAELKNQPQVSLDQGQRGSELCSDARTLAGSTEQYREAATCLC